MMSRTRLKIRQSRFNFDLVPKAQEYLRDTEAVYTFTFSAIQNSHYFPLEAEKSCFQHPTTSPTFLRLPIFRLRMWWCTGGWWWRDVLIRRRMAATKNGAQSWKRRNVK
jgi:hypothetical protein